jgi:hypothetical protein
LTVSSTSGYVGRHHRHSMPTADAHGGVRLQLTLPSMSGYGWCCRQRPATTGAPDDVRRSRATANDLDDIRRSVATTSALDIRCPVATAGGLVDVRLRLVLVDVRLRLTHSSTSGYGGGVQWLPRAVNDVRIRHALSPMSGVWWQRLTRSTTSGFRWRRRALSTFGVRCL